MVDFVIGLFMFSALVVLVLLCIIAASAWRTLWRDYEEAGRIARANERAGIH